ncbi:hypothetical protein TcasGA2_TC004498 [Tribolium castaneum]|uniref:Uncharacterized protein n=1 Tax=Tribolium castaneum TaxID=7070 RepID=D6WCE7_TRICA|nr:hypothetical protein TcasGA2_TC004498 [Tribolium castaneum]
MVYALSALIARNRLKLQSNKNSRQALLLPKYFAQGYRKSINSPRVNECGGQLTFLVVFRVKVVTTDTGYHPPIRVLDHVPETPFHTYRLRLSYCSAVLLSTRYLRIYFPHVFTIISRFFHRSPLASPLQGLLATRTCKYHRMLTSPTTLPATDLLIRDNQSRKTLNSITRDFLFEFINGSSITCLTELIASDRRRINYIHAATARFNSSQSCAKLD